MPSNPRTQIRGTQIKDESIEDVDIASGSIRETELHETAISGQPTLDSANSSNDRLLIWDADDGTTGSLKQIAPANLGVTASPAGSDTQVQYNNGGSTAGATKLLYDESNGRLKIGDTNAPQNVLDVFGNVSDFVAIIDNDASSNAHGLKVTSDGTGTGTNILDLESATTTFFRARGDGRVGIGKVTSLPAAILTVSSSNTDSDLAIAHKIHHIGDANTSFSFDTDKILLEAGGSTELQVASDAVLVKEYIKHIDDENTFIQFADDKIVLKSGGKAMITLEENTSAPHEITLNDGSNNIDLVVKGNGSGAGNPGVKFDASTNRLGVNGVGTPDKALHVGGSMKLDGSQPTIFFADDADEKAEIGINSSDNILIENKTINKHIVFKVNDQGVVREGLRINGAVPEVVVNEGSESLVDFRVESNNKTHALFVDGDNEKVFVLSGSGVTGGDGLDVNFFVSGSINSKSTKVAGAAGTALFGGDTVISGALHVKGGHDFEGATAAAIILDSATASKIVWDSDNDGNSPDAAVYESGGSLYLSSSNDVRIYAGTDDVLVFPKDMLQVIEHSEASGNFASFFAQPTTNTFYNVLDVGDTGVVINEDSRADYDFRVETDGDSNMLFVDAGNNKIGVSTGTPHSGFHMDVSTAFATRTITQNHAVTDADHTIFVNATGTNIDVTLPTAVNIPGRQYIIKRVDAAGTAVTIQTNGSETIDGAASATLTDKRSVVIQSDNSNWWILAEYISPP